MKRFVFIFLLAVCAGPALAHADVDFDNGYHKHSAPAPLIGFGLPALLGIGGAFLSAQLFKRGRP